MRLNGTTHPKSLTAKGYNIHKPGVKDNIYTNWGIIHNCPQPNHMTRWLPLQRKIIIAK